jgi:hypothetical protein
MTRNWSFAVFAVLCFAGRIHAQSAGQPNEGLTISAGASSGAFSLSWWGKAGRTYFILHSSDLYSWSFFTTIESGSDSLIQWGFTTGSPNFFTKLEYTDIPTTDPVNDDFNGAGISNEAQINLNMSPLVPVPVATVTSPTWVSVGP